jgi:hypothetical protein
MECGGIMIQSGKFISDSLAKKPIFLYFFVTYIYKCQDDEPEKTPLSGAQQPGNHPATLRPIPRPSV